MDEFTLTVALLSHHCLNQLPAFQKPSANIKIYPEGNQCDALNSRELSPSILARMVLTCEDSRPVTLMTLARVVDVDLRSNLKADLDLQLRRTVDRLKTTSVTKALAFTRLHGLAPSSAYIKDL